MKKLLVTFIITLSTSGFLFSQETTKLVGDWSSSTAEGEGVYTLFEYDGKLHSILYLWKDDQVQYSLDDHLSHLTPSDYEQMSEYDLFREMEDYVLFYDFEKKEDNWQGNFILDDEGNTIQAYLSYINENTIEVGSMDPTVDYKMIWNRIQ